MQNQSTIGIDISSAKLDICLRKEGSNESFVIKNEVRAIKKFFSAFKKEALLIGMENTGRYNWALFEVLAELPQHRTFVIPPIHLKKSMGLVRGKNDKIDAVRIALFTEKNHSDLREWKPVSANIQKIKVLLTERNYRIRTRKQLQKQRHDYSKMKKLQLDSELQKMNEQLVIQLNKQITKIEERIQDIIKSDTELALQAKLIRSVPGAGKVLCWTMLAKTEGFTVIQAPRKMACYSGVVPFDNQSGSSIRGRHRVSVYADKSIKTILHLAAMSAIQRKNDLRVYYQRKVAEGKNKMSILNAVRNKIVHRIFAVIKNQTTYSHALHLS